MHVKEILGESRLISSLNDAIAALGTLLAGALGIQRVETAPLGHARHHRAVGDASEGFPGGAYV
jgi:hypothetical protein